MTTKTKRTAAETQVVVADARYRRGFSGRDHLLDDADFAGVVGRVYGSEAKAREAAEALSTETVPVEVTCYTLAEIPADHIQAAVNRFAAHLYARGGAVSADQGETPKPYVSEGYARIRVSVDHGSNESVGGTTSVLVYRPET